jgi:hypothetical protein
MLIVEILKRGACPSSIFPLSLEGKGRGEGDFRVSISPFYKKEIAVLERWIVSLS